MFLFLFLFLCVLISSSIVTQEKRTCRENDSEEYK